MVSFNREVFSLTHFLCDMENVQGNWSAVLSHAKSGDKVTLFFTDKVKQVSLSLFGKGCLSGVQFNFVECENGRPNALDFQLVTELGRLSIIESDTDFVIVTGDQGFQSVVGFMRDRGVHVECFNPNVPDVVSEIEPVVDVPLVEEVVSPDVGSTVVESGVLDVYIGKLSDFGLSDSQVHKIAEIFMATMGEPSNKRKLACRNYIRTFYGAKDGEALYCKIKPVVHDVAKNGPFPEILVDMLPDVNELRKIFKGSKFDTSDDALKVVAKALRQAAKRVNPKQSLLNQLTNKFGSKRGTIAYNLLSKFL